MPPGRAGRWAVPGAAGGGSPPLSQPCAQDTLTHTHPRGGGGRELSGPGNHSPNRPCHPQPSHCLVPFARRLTLGLLPILEKLGNFPGKSKFPVPLQKSGAPVTPGLCRSRCWELRTAALRTGHTSASPAGAPAPC